MTPQWLRQAEVTNTQHLLGARCISSLNTQPWEAATLASLTEDRETECKEPTQSLFTQLLGWGHWL